MQDIQTKAAKIKLVIFDVDGVLTDGSLYLGNGAQEYKVFNTKDGYGMKMLQQGGVDIAIITARTSEAVHLRMQSLGVEQVFQGIEDKSKAYAELKNQTGLQDEQMAYVGDDVMDLPVMTQVGLAIAVSDAHPLVKQHAHWRTSSAGGRGAAREVCELLLDAQGKLQNLLNQYL